MANERLPYILDFQNGSVVNAILKKAQQLPDKAQLDQQLAQKATMSDVQRETQNLQNQINEIVRAPESGGDVAAEVAQARVSADSTVYPTLKARLDAEQNAQSDKIDQLDADVSALYSNTYDELIEAGYSGAVANAGEGFDCDSYGSRYDTAVVANGNIISNKAYSSVYPEE